MAKDKKNLARLITTNWQLPESINIPIFENPACRGMPTEWWFPEKNQTGPKLANTRKAIRICMSCSEQRKCADFALDNPSIHGIWGGISAKSRIQLRTQIQNSYSLSHQRNLEYSKMRSVLETETHGSLPI